MVNPNQYCWILNGIYAPHIQSIDKTQFPKITIHCSAQGDGDYPDPEDEIAVFEAMSSLNITTEVTDTGGTDVQTSIDGELIPVSDGVNNWFAGLYRPQYTVDNMARISNFIAFDLILELQIVNKDIIPDAPTDPTNTKPYNLITNGYKYKIKTFNMATKYLGTFTFNWDGSGYVYICSDWLADPATDTINIDDAITVTNGDGTTIDVVYGGGAFPNQPGGNNSTSGPPLNITGLLSEGTNQLTIGIRDIYGVYLGCGPLFMVQVR